MALTFPKKREDGSFSVTARFAISDPNVAPLVEQYVRAWIEGNRDWIRIWRSNVIEVERLHFANDFASDPKVVTATDGGVAIAFEGRPDSRRWKDWMVRLVEELTSVFAELEFKGFEQPT